MEGLDNGEELLYAERSTTDQTAIDVGLSEELGGIASVAAPTIEDRAVVSDLLTVLLDQ